MKPETMAAPAAPVASGASKYDRLIADARGVPPVPTMVAHPATRPRSAAPSRRPRRG